MSALEPATSILDHVAQDRVERNLGTIADETPGSWSGRGSGSGCPRSRRRRPPRTARGRSPRRCRSAPGSVGRARASSPAPRHRCSRPRPRPGARSSGPTRARTASCTCVKTRTWPPSPYTCSGWPASAQSTKRGMTMPYAPLCRGPTVLKKRPMTTGSPLLRWYARARYSSSALEQAYDQRMDTPSVTSSVSRNTEHARPGLLAVDLGGGRHEHLAAVAQRGLQHVLGAAHVAIDRLDRALDHQLHADGGRQVHDHVGLGDRAVTRVSRSSTDPCSKRKSRRPIRCWTFRRLPVLRSSSATTG